ncbi:hypothetical protein BBP40_012133 [Aspergillus hancockii]|nr:hypothetical protein BBP40_012133 [Aspergillus hancockii]
MRPGSEGEPGFFAYYGSHSGTARSSSFDWVQDVVSIRTPGGILSKLGKSWNTAKTDEDGNQFRFLIAIDDPFEHNHDVGRTVPNKGLETIRAELTRAQTVIRGIQEIPGASWEWRTDNGELGQGLLAEAEDNPQARQLYRASSFPEPKDAQAPGIPGMNCLKKPRACNGFVSRPRQSSPRRSRRSAKVFVEKPL